MFFCLTNFRSKPYAKQQTLRKLLFSFMMLFMVIGYSQSKPEEINVTPNGILDKVFFSNLTSRELNTIDLSHLANGYYLAKLSNETETTTVKLIKN